MNREEVLNAVAEMSVLELSQLIKDMEEKFGVSAAAAVAVAAPAAGAAGGRGVIPTVGGHDCWCPRRAHRSSNQPAFDPISSLSCTVAPAGGGSSVVDMSFPGCL